MVTDTEGIVLRQVKALGGRRMILLLSLIHILALKRGETTIAPTHLLNMETGEYNVSYIRELFPDTKMALIKGCLLYTSRCV